MDQFEYRVVAAPRKSKKVKGAKTAQDRFARTLTDLINEEARLGWEFVSTETLPAEEKSSMLSATKETFHTVLVFRRFVASSGTVVPKPKMAMAAPVRDEPRAEPRTETRAEPRSEPLFRSESFTAQRNPRVGPAED